jgi:hypothetical protein
VSPHIKHKVNGILLQDGGSPSMRGVCNVEPHLCGVTSVDIQTQFSENGFEQFSHEAFAL